MPHPMMRTAGPRRLPARGARSGFSLLEVLIAGVFLTIGLGGFASAVAHALRLRESTRETGIAREAAQQLLERMYAMDLGDVFAAYNADAGDDAKIAHAPGASFQVRGLAPASDGALNTVSFPVVDGALREDVEDTELGMPRDLNGDGLLDGADHADDYRLLPVRIEIHWTGPAGIRKYVLNGLIGGA